MIKTQIGAAEASAHPDMPAFGRTAARLASLDEHRMSIDSLCEIAIADPALAQKILRAAQSARMGTASTSNTSLSRSIMALGVEQVRAMAIALDALSAAKSRKLDPLMVKNELTRALCAAFCSRELARFDGLEAEAAALRSLFFGCSEIFCALYEPFAWAQARSIAKAKGAPWINAFERVSGSTRAEFCERLMRSWGLDDRLSAPLLRSESDPARALISLSQTLSEALCSPDAQAGAHAFRLFMERSPERLKAALAGLKRGAIVSSAAGVTCSSALFSAALREEKLDLAELLPKEDPESPYAPAPIPALSPWDADAVALLPLAADELSRRSLEGKGSRSLSQLALEMLAPALGMRFGSCAFGPSIEDARLVAELGDSKLWAREFAEARRLKKPDLFNHALTRGMDAMTHDARALKGALPVELVPRGCEPPRAFAFFPLMVGGVARGYAVLSSPAAAPPFTEDLKASARAVCARLAECLADHAAR